MVDAQEMYIWPTTACWNETTELAVGAKYKKKVKYKNNIKGISVHAAQHFFLYFVAFDFQRTEG